ncbi:MAG: PAS domain S-box protein [Chlorobi bacterium]|nr:PAS domain S-box protein [Chlorobiota bacterium]
MKFFQNKYPDIEFVKNRFINIALITGIVLGFLIFFPTVFTAYKNKVITINNISYLSVLLIFSLVYIFRRKINLATRTLFIVTGLLLFIIINTVSFGIFSDNKIFIIILLVIVFFIFSPKSAIWLSILLTVLYVVLAYYTINGLLKPKIAPDIRAVSENTWIINYLLTAIVTLSVIFLLRGFYNKFLQLINNLEEKNIFIKEKESNYTEVFNVVTDAIFIHDMKGYITDVNESMVKMFKYPKSELLNMDSRLLNQSYAPYDAEHYTNYVMQLNTKEKIVFEWHPKDKFGNLIWVEVTLVKTIIGGKASVLTIIKNIDKQKKLSLELENYRDKLEKKVKLRTEELQAINEELLSNNEELKVMNDNIEYQKNIIEEKERRLNSIINNQGEGFSINDSNEYFVSANYKAHEIFNVPEGKLIGMNLKDFFDENEWTKIKEQSKLRKKNIRSSYETKITLKDGTVKYIIVTGIPDFNEDGKISGTIANFRDITERIKKENKLRELNEEFETINEELNEANEELTVKKNTLQDALDELKRTQNQLLQSEKMASLGVLAAGVAHEINNPLNYILGGVTGLEKILKDQIEKAGAVPVMDAIKEGVERAGKIVAGLSHFSRNSSSGTEDCEINSIIDNCITILNNKLKDKIEIKKMYQEPPIHIKCNEGKIHQVFLNILSNAEQSIEKKGTIFIRTETNSRFVVISIEDTGTGIPEEHLSKITDPFFTTKDPGAGIGLGLSIVHRIIEEHKGTIEFKSTTGKGTKTVITLPK